MLVKGRFAFVPPIYRAAAVLGVLIFLLALIGLPLLSSADEKGAFVGRIVSEWLPESRRMKLLEPFTYIDANKRRWLVPSGTVIGGASIPQTFWTIIRAPFSGAYRNASVIHDYYCESRTCRSQ